MKKPPDPHYRHRFPAALISHAVWLSRCSECGSDLLSLHDGASSLHAAVTALKIGDEIISILGARTEFQRRVGLRGTGSLDRRT
jgi:hypothetical protein